MERVSNYYWKEWGSACQTAQEQQHHMQQQAVQSEKYSIPTVQKNKASQLSINISSFTNISWKRFPVSSSCLKCKLLFWSCVLQSFTGRMQWAGWQWTWTAQVRLVSCFINLQPCAKCFQQVSPRKMTLTKTLSLFLVTESLFIYNYCKYLTFLLKGWCISTI